MGMALHLTLAWPAVACDVPVFRYALERWEPDAYEVVLLHDLPLDPVDETRWRRLTGDDSSAPNPLNLIVRSSESDGRTDASLEARWKSEAESSSPWIALYYPSSAPLQTHLWAGPLTEPNCDALLDSPVRRQIVQDLLNGVSAVFVLLESSDSAADQAADQAAAETLTRELAASEDSLVLPERTEDDVPDIDESKVRIDFSTVRVSRQDPDEKILVEMLLGLEPGLRDIASPMVFPVYGRGRALYALVGKGINPKTIRAACAMLTGPCSCQIKDENPGVDLLLAMDWDAGIGEFLLENPEPAALPSPALLQASAPEALEAREPGLSPVLSIGIALVAGMAAVLSISLAMSLRKGRTES
jgi:hypothetical protein